MALIQCSKCKAKVSDLAKNCPQCGVAIKVPCRCMECGNIVSPNAISCPQCGAPLKYGRIQNQQYKNPYIGNDSYHCTNSGQTIKHNWQDGPSFYEQAEVSYRPRSTQYSLEYPTLTFKEAVSECFRKYATFAGRARRSEYWFWRLFNILINIFISCILGIFLADGDETATGIIIIISILYSLVVFLPGLAVLVRRLHDIGKSGNNILWLFVPIVGGIMLLVWLLQDSDAFENKYGASPKHQYDPIAHRSTLAPGKRNVNYVSNSYKKQNEYKTTTNGKVKNEISFCEPQPQPTFGEAISICFRKYANFSGRARRSEYWFWGLFQMIITSTNTIFLSICLATEDTEGVAVGSLIYLILSGIWFLATFLPSFAVSVRRFHDIGKSGWSILWCFVPIIGVIILFVYTITESDPDTNHYGISPKYSCEPENIDYLQCKNFR